MDLLGCFGSRKKPGTKATSPNDLLEKVDLLQDEGSAVQNDLWQLCFTEKLQEWNPKDRVFLQNLLDEGHPSSPEPYLGYLSGEYATQGFSQYRERIRTVLKSVEPFISAVNTMVQSNQIASLVWGGLTLIYQHALNFVRLFDDVQAMILDLTKTLPRFRDYYSVLSTPRLQAALRDVYNEYLGFCISATNVLETSQMSLCVKLHWSDFNFSTAKARLANCKAEFESEANLASVQTDANRHREILSRLEDQRVAEAIMTGLVPQNPTFVGRQDALEQMKTALNPALNGQNPREPRDRRSCVIHGTGGLGKSQVAVEYVYRYSHCYTHVFWLRAETDALLSDSILKINRKVKIETADTRLERQIELYREWLELRAHNWLLVFDNVDGADAIVPFWPAGTCGSIIITTQDITMTGFTSASVNLKAMTVEEGSALIREHLKRGRSEMSDAERLSIELGGHPLAISHFAGYVTRSQCPLKHILQALQHRKHTLQIWSSDSLANLNGYSRTLDTVWDLALTRLSEDARWLLNIIAFLNPDSIPENMFVGPEPAFMPKQWEYWEIHRFNDAITPLQERHLVERDEIEGLASLRTHRSLQMRILHELDANTTKRQKVYEDARSIVRRAFPSPNIIKRGDEDNFTVSSRYLPHIESMDKAVVRSHPPIQGDIAFAELLGDGGRFLFDLGYRPEAVPLLESSKNICNDLLPSQGKDVLKLLPSVLSLLALYQRFEGIAGRLKSIDLICKAVQKQHEYVRILPPKAIKDLDILNLGRFNADYACGLLHVENTVKAEPVFHEALAYFEQAGGEKKNGVRCGMGYMHQGFISAANNRLEEADRLCRRAWDLIVGAVGPDSHQMLWTKFQKALLLFNTGQLEGSVALHVEVLDARRLRLGKLNHETLSSQYQVAVCQQWSGDTETAEQNLRAILQRTTTNMQWRDEDLARAAFRLSLILKHQGRLQQAHLFESMALEWRSQWVDSIPEDIGEGLLPPERAEMARFDYAVYLWHGRTAGIWAAGQYW